jgi:hypothetical protein
VTFIPRLWAPLTCRSRRPDPGIRVALAGWQTGVGGRTRVGCAHWQTARRSHFPRLHDAAGGPGKHKNDRVELDAHRMPPCSLGGEMMCCTSLQTSSLGDQSRDRVWARDADINSDLTAALLCDCSEEPSQHSLCYSPVWVPTPAVASLRNWKRCRPLALSVSPSYMRDAEVSAGTHTVDDRSQDRRAR